MIKKDRIISLTQRLVREQSENPPGNEYQTAMIVKEEMERIGLEVSIHEFEKKRPNIIGTLKGDGTSKESLLLAVHTDVVPAGKGWKKDPYSAEIEDGKIYGRGTSDCKGHIAVCLEAARSIIENKNKLKGDLIIAATVDEEAGDKKGLLPILEKDILKPTDAVAIDTGDFKIVTAQKGVLHITIHINGKKAHGAYPHKGINAIEIAANIITGLKSHKFTFTPHPLFKEPTINIGTIKGGEKVNIVADRCDFETDIRYLPGMDPKEIMTDVEYLIKKHSNNYSIDIDSHILAYELKGSNRLIENMKDAFKRQGKPAKTEGSSGATIIAEFKKYNIPAIATGFCINDCMHVTDEYVVIDDLVEGAKIIEEFILLMIRE